MNPGKLNKTIGIYQRTDQRDASGQPLETWILLYTLFSSIKPLVGKDFLAAKQIVSEISHDITIRYRHNIKAKQRVKYIDRYFEIVYVINVGEKNKWLYLKCKEVDIG